MPMSQFYTKQDIADMGEAMRKSVAGLVVCVGSVGEETVSTLGDGHEHDGRLWDGYAAKNGGQAAIVAFLNHLYHNIYPRVFHDLSFVIPVGDFGLDRRLV